MSEVKKENLELVGYYNPLGIEFYPYPLVPIVTSSKGFAVVYGDGKVAQVSRKTIEEYQSRPDCTMLKPESRIPFTPTSCVYGVNKNHVLAGDIESVVRNLRLALNGVPSESKEYSFITGFIVYETSSPEMKTKIMANKINDAEMRQILLNPEESK